MTNTTLLTWDAFITKNEDITEEAGLPSTTDVENGFNMTYVAIRRSTRSPHKVAAILTSLSEATSSSTV